MPNAWDVVDVQPAGQPAAPAAPAAGGWDIVAEHPTREVGALESASRSVQAGLRDITKYVGGMPLAGAGFVADALHSALTGEQHTELQDAAFEHIVAPEDAAIERLAIDPTTEHQSFGAKLAGAGAGMVPSLALMLATRGEAGAPALANEGNAVVGAVREALTHSAGASAVPGLVAGGERASQRQDTNAGKALLDALAGYEQTVAQNTLPMAAPVREGAGTLEAIASRAAAGSVAGPALSGTIATAQGQDYSGEQAGIDALVSAVAAQAGGQRERAPDRRAPAEQLRAELDAARRAAPPEPVPEPAVATPRQGEPPAPAGTTAPPAQGPQRTPFANPSEHARTTFVAKATARGIPEDVAHDLAPQAPVDRTTGFVDGRQGAVDTTIERAQQHVADTGEPAVWVGGDIANLGGLNKHFGSRQADADVHYRAMAEIMHDELKGLGGDVVPMRTGGDEIGAVVVNVGRPDVQAAVDRARSRIQAYAAEHGLDVIPHKETGREPGVGMHFGIADIAPGVRVKDILDEADNGIDISRAGGGNNVAEGTVEAPRDGAPGERPAGDQGGSAAPVAGVSREAGASEHGAAVGRGGDPLERGGDPLEEVSRLQRSVAEARAAGDSARVAELTPQLQAAQERASAPQDREGDFAPVEDRPTATLHVTPKGEASPEPAPTPAEPPRAPEAPAQAAGEGLPPTGTKHAVTDAEREAEGRPARESSAPRTNEEALADARADLEANPHRGDEVVEKLRSGGTQSVSAHDEAVLMAHKVAQRAKRDAAAKRATDPSLSPEERAVARREYDEANARVIAIDEAAANSGREWGRMGQLRQRLLREDFSFEAMERRARVARDRPLTPEEQAAVRAQADKIEALQAQLDAAESRNTLAEHKRAIVREGRAAAGKQRTRSTRLSEKLEKPAADARARLRAKLGTAHSGVDPGMFADAATIGAYHLARGVEAAAAWAKAMRAELGEKLFGAIEPRLSELRKAAEAILAKEGHADPAEAILAGVDKDSLTGRDIARLVREKILAGVHGEGPIMAAVHADLQKAGIELSERDVRRLYSDYGKVSFPSKEAVAAEARELRRLVQLQESIDRLKEGLAPLKSGPQRDKATQAIREKQAQLIDLLKAAEQKHGASPEKLAGYQDARRTALQNAIDDLEKQLAEGKRTERTPAPELNDENKALAARRDALRAELDDLTNPPGDARNEAEKRSLRKRIEALNERIAGKGEPPKAPEHRADDAEQAGLRAQVERLQARLRDQQLEAGKRAAVQQQIAELMQRLAGKEKPDKPAPAADSARVRELKRIRDELADQLADLEAKPKKSPEERYQSARGKSLQRMLDDVQGRIASGDFSRPGPRAERALSPENARLAHQLAEAKAEFARQQFEAEMARRPRWKKVLGGVQEATNLARALMTSLDLSAVLRQGGFIAFGHPVRAAKAFGPMLRAFASAQAEHTINAEIASRPNARLYKKFGLELTDAHHHSLTKMEEAFMSRLVDKLPKALGGGLVRGSNRAYTTFLNRLRADSFDAMAATLGRSGELTPDEGHAIAGYINIATGRGNIGKNNRAAVGLNTVFFAPRLVASRFQLLAGTPMYGGTARSRMLVATEYARFLAGAAVVYGLASMATDGEDGIVTFDPRSTDFGRIKLGNTYIDPLMGLAQVTVLLSREASGEKVTASGKLSPLRDSNRLGDLTGDAANYPKSTFGGDNAASIIGRFMRTKLAPVPGAALDLLTGEDVVGNKVTPADVGEKLVTPMSLQDINKIMQENGVPEGTSIEMLNLLGMGVQYRQPREHKTSRKGNGITYQ